MLAPLATVAFLSILWLMIRVAVEMADGSLVKVISALKGQSLLAQPSTSIRPITVRYRPQVVKVRRARAVPEWRAAA